ncbi:MAG: iron-containing alcohol dehydrogenase family protein [Thermoleophilia bacterium]
MAPAVYDTWPNRVVIGAGAAGTVGAEIRALDGSRALVVTDQGVLAVPAVRDLLASLRAELPTVEVYDRVQSDPTDLGVADLVAFMRRVEPDVVVAVGGGSPIDAAKCANLLFTHGGRPFDYVKGGPASAVPGRLLPLVAIPTTAGTASEVTSVSVIVDTASGRKVSVGSPLLVPTVSVLDPQLTVSLPPHLTAWTGMDALTHLVEAYVSTVNFAPADAVALTGLGMIAHTLPAVVKDGSDLALREEMLVASMMGGIAFNHNRLGLTHAMAHQLSTVCGVHHGLANGILLPHVMAFNLPAVPAKFARIAHTLGVDSTMLSPEAAGAAGIDRILELSREIGIPRSLEEVGVTRERIPAMVQAALADSVIRKNPRPATAEDVEALYHAAFEGR